MSSSHTSQKSDSEYLLKIQNLLINTASTYISLPSNQLDTALKETLAEIGSTMGADRLYIFLYNWNPKTASNTHEWCADGIEPQIDRLQAIDISQFDQWIENHKRGERVVISDVSAMHGSDPFRIELENQSIQSVAMVPMMASGKCVGFLGMDMVRRKHTFTDEEVRLLILISDLIVNVRSRLDSETTIRERLKELNCIYSITSLGEDKNQKEEDYLHEVVSVLPKGFLDPAQTYACIAFENKIYTSPNFQKTENYISAEIQLFKQKLGHIIVYCHPDITFLREEVALLEGARNNIERFIETRRALEAIRANEQRLQNLVNTLTSYVLRTDMEGRHTYWNGKFEADFGWIYPEHGLSNADSLLSICDYHHPRTIDVVEKCVQSPGVAFKV
jgi:GAF domain-containing protein